MQTEHSLPTAPSAAPVNSKGGFLWFLAYLGFWLLGAVLNGAIFVIAFSLTSDIMFLAILVLFMWGLGHFIDATPLAFMNSLRKRNRIILLALKGFTASGALIASGIWLVMTAALVRAQNEFVQPAFPFLDQLIALFG